MSTDNEREGYVTGVSTINVKPTQYQIFKGKAAARFQIEKPKEQYKVGCLYLQIAPSKGEVNGNNTYDWENKKVSVKFGINDISKIYHQMKCNEKIDLFHDFGDSTKGIKFEPKDTGGYFLNVQETNKKTGLKNAVNIAISAEETSTLTALLFWAIPLVHNWM